mmetsp:Transcript_9260/g.7055  ORF Transcript_9260/g.7055 Transcript_9260/m.7055 type:complete len:101 (-) Transcript_9260:14-316(-)
MLMKFDGHLARNGFKLLATSNYRFFNHNCTPEMLSFPDGYSAKVGNLAFNDFRNMLVYYQTSKWMLDVIDEYQTESYFMESQGNFRAFQHSYRSYQNFYY